MTKISSIIFDLKRTLYDPETSTLIDGAVDLLEFFSTRNVPLYLIGKGKQEMYDETVRLNVAKYFTEILFVEGSKDQQDFIKYIDIENPHNTIVIGDRSYSELAVGKSLGATTIWVKQGKFANEEPEDDSQKPNYIVNNLLEVGDLNIFKD
jgi:ribonucleotide monophosphatase NagD (HAD superfamily)